MDLFADLPPPSSPKKDVPSLFGDLPPATETPVLGSKREPDKEENEKNLESIKRQKTQAAPFSFEAFIAERKGERDEMQDAHCILTDLIQSLEKPLPSFVSQLVYFGIFDGHNGARASQFAAQNLHLNIVKKFPKGDIQNVDREVKKCLLDAYKRTDDEFLQKASEASPSWKDGSTGVTILGVDDVIYVANIGDSRAVLCREGESGAVQSITLTKDHSPVTYEERTRIQKAGGVVREGRVMGALEVSRSFGDGRFKHCGVICTPDVRKCTVTKDDRFILMACDGLWKVFSSEEAVGFVSGILKDTSLLPPKDPVPSTNFETKTSVDPFAYRCEAACNKMAVEAVKRGCADNVTIMLVVISMSSTT